MTEKEKQIEVIMEILDNQRCGSYEDAAIALYNSGYRIINKYRIVIPFCEYEKLKKKANKYDKIKKVNCSKEIKKNEIKK